MHAKTTMVDENRSRATAHSIIQRHGKAKSDFSFIDNRKEAVLQKKMHEMVSNNAQAEKQLRMSHVIANAPCQQTPDNKPKSTTQRMVAIANEDKSSVKDSLILNNLNYALGHFGGPVGDFKSNRKFGETKAGDRLGIVAHGRPGEIGGYNAKGVANALTVDPAIDKGLASIVLYSCNAGMDQESVGINSSLVHGLSAELKGKGYEIGVEGQKGIGFGFKGIGERTTKGTEKEGDRNWFTTRDKLLGRAEYSDLKAGGGGFKEADEMLEAGGHSKIEIAAMSLTEKASAISEIMAPFWRDVEKEMGSDLYDHLKGWVRVLSFVGGGQLVQDSR